MIPRFHVLQEISKRSKSYKCNKQNYGEQFGIHVFNKKVMQKMLPEAVYKNVLLAMQGQEKIKDEYADTIATAMKDWALSFGATHYSHWFQPLTGASAEKHDSFIDWKGADELIEKFSGKDLLQGEPDASSFPSGGLRSTYEARGYTGWDPTSPVFLWTGGDGLTLCIPSVFFSWTGDVLDAKIPLLRSDKKINDATIRMLKFFNVKADYVYSTLGCEQEYFVIDRGIKNLRSDLLLGGRTLYGAPSPKGQELQDHYFGSVKDRILSYMQDFENEAIKLGIPVKTRHNEVAPAQHEVAPVYEKVSQAVDHNILLMELMRQVAVKHHLSCLLHEKPFKGLNGSGKHCNWSLSTNTGLNLLNPTDNPKDTLHFLVLLTAIIHAVHRHAALLRASIASFGNDYRLGGHEAPPAIISIYLGQALEALLNEIQKDDHKKNQNVKAKYNWGSLVLPDLTKDDTDRNRTSPFAFTGNKFEFRAVGSSVSTAFPITVLNTAVAESLNEIMDEIEATFKKNKKALESSLEVVKKYLKISSAIIFGGDNYSESWKKEAVKRKLPVLSKSYMAFDALIKPSTIKMFEGVLNESELKSRYEIALETHNHTANIEANLMLDMFYSEILPTAMKYNKSLIESVQVSVKMFGKLQSKEKNKIAKIYNSLIEKAVKAAEKLKMEKERAEKAQAKIAAKLFAENVLDQMDELRILCDQIETMTEDAIWPLPKYKEILFII